MALKDSIRHFKDVDGYSEVIKKEDIDNNFDLLADEIDVRVKFDPDKESVAVGYKSVVDGDRSFAFGYECEANEDYGFAFGNGCKVNEDNSFAFGYDCEANETYSFAFGYDCETGGTRALAFGDTCKATADYSEAWGYKCEASAVYSYARGYQAKASADAAQVFGASIENKQIISISYGGSDGTISNQNLRHFNIQKTTDDTQTEFNTPLALWLKSLNYIIIKCEALQDDYATKWIFERKLIVRVNENGEITIDSDDNTDIVKDDSDWAFDIETVNDSENPTIKLKATGKADTNIAWGIEVENRQTYWN
jgi:hypothetical protein